MADATFTGQRSYIRGRSVFVTYNIPMSIDGTDGKQEFIIDTTDVQYYVFQFERVEHLHVHALIQFKRGVRKRFAEVQAMLGPNGPLRAHLEYVKDMDACRGYCSSDTWKGKDKCRVSGPFEYGEYVAPHRGERTDVEKLTDSVIYGRKSFGELIESKLVKTVAKYTRFYDMLQQEQSRRKRRDRDVPKVTVIWGCTGKGKTRMAMYKLRSETGNEPYIVTANQGGLWFCDYAGENGLLFDEFGPEMMKDTSIEQIIRLLDPYVMQLRRKGRPPTYAEWNFVIFTSNLDPRRWYPEAQDHHRDALFRRLNLVGMCDNPTEIHMDENCQMWSPPDDTTSQFHRYIDTMRKYDQRCAEYSDSD